MRKVILAFALAIGAVIATGGASHAATVSPATTIGKWSGSEAAVLDVSSRWKCSRYTSRCYGYYHKRHRHFGYDRYRYRPYYYSPYYYYPQPFYFAFPGVSFYFSAPHYYRHHRRHY